MRHNHSPMNCLGAMKSMRCAILLSLNHRKIFPRSQHDSRIFFPNQEKNFPKKNAPQSGGNTFPLRAHSPQIARRAPCGRGRPRQWSSSKGRAGLHSRRSIRRQSLLSLEELRPSACRGVRVEAGGAGEHTLWA